MEAWNRVLHGVAPDSLAILAGAGISLDAPSNLLDGATFTAHLVNAICPPGQDPAWLLTQMQLPAGLHRPGEFVRFEVFMAELVESGIDPDLEVLDCLDRCDRPNRHHDLLAQLIHAGALVMTTNFDRLIEVAWHNRFGRHTPLRVAATDEDFGAAAHHPQEPPTLWKLHGSISIGGRDSRQSVQATMTSVIATTMRRNKEAFLKGALRDRDLLVMGYSGSDDLDIMPVLASTESDRRLIWVNHARHARPVVRSADEIRRTWRTRWARDVVGKGRMLHEDFPWQTDPARKDDTMSFVEGDTGDLTDTLLNRMPGGAVVQQPGEYAFGRRHAANTAAYFTAWAARAAAGSVARNRAFAKILSNRTFRPDVNERVEQMQSASRMDSPLPDTSARERIDLLIERYNEIVGPADPKRTDQPAQTLDDVRQELTILLTLVPRAYESVGLRLLACLVWALEGPEVGMAAFQRVVERDRRDGREQRELATLITWRGLCGYNRWTDLFPSAAETQLLDRFGRDQTDRWWRDAIAIERLVFPDLPRFPDSERQRLRELMERIGHMPVLLRGIAALVNDVVDDDPAMLALTELRLREILRFTVDMGDVRGEVLASLSLGRVYLTAERFGAAAIEFYRALELNALARVEGTELIAHAGLQQCDQIVSEHGSSIRATIREGLWNVPDPPKGLARLLRRFRRTRSHS